jgi:hypothetical protein
MNADVRDKRVQRSLSPGVSSDTYDEGRAATMTVHEMIPDGLRPEVDAALTWLNRREGTSFEVTGIVDPETTPATSGARELRLILCDGDRCEQRAFRVTPNEGGFDVTLADAAAQDHDVPPPELDPPPGARRGWLDRALAEHAFVVLVFYRGFW